MLEQIAVALALIYVVLAIKEQRLCWIAAFLSSAAYVPTFAEARLYTEACLQFFFMAASYYGWREWSPEQNRTPLQIHLLTKWRHVQTSILTALLGSLLGLMLHRYSNASLPFLDSQITCFSIAATYLQARKILENWIYWIVIDLTAMGVCLFKELYLTAGLYGLYVGLAVVGWRQWRAAVK